MSRQWNKIIIINPYCHQGRGWKRWLGIKKEVYQKLYGPINEVVLEKGMEMGEALLSFLDLNAKCCIISAGGDGTVHFLVNYLLSLNTERLNNVAVGAVGLGSSNDFLKPFNEKLKNIPVRINCNSGTLLHDVGLARYSNGTNTIHQKYFVVNASMGVTAEANWNFNHPNLVLKFLKKYNTGAAIGYAAISTILKHSNIHGTLSYSNKEQETLISNINILKIPYVSGSLYYNQNITRDDGNLGLNACVNMSIWELLSVLGRLRKGIFPASPKTLTGLIKNFQLKASKPFTFECDGETEKTDSISISIIPHALKVLKS